MSHNMVQFSLWSPAWAFLPPGSSLHCPVTRALTGTPTRIHYSTCRAERRTTAVPPPLSHFVSKRKDGHGIPYQGDPVNCPDCKGKPGLPEETPPGTHCHA